MASFTAEITRSCSISILRIHSLRLNGQLRELPLTADRGLYHAAARGSGKECILHIRLRLFHLLLHLQDLLLHLLLLAHHPGAAGEAASRTVTLCHNSFAPYLMLKLSSRLPSASNSVMRSTPAEGLSHGGLCRGGAPLDSSVHFRGVVPVF